MKKIIFLCLVMILTACSSDLVSVEYKDDMTINDQTITIEGETDLEDGSLINYQITDFAASEIKEEGTTEVQDGSFSYTFDVSEYGSGEYEVYTAFLPYEQTDEIQEIYGGMGENLQTSSEVIYSEDVDDLKLIESRKTFEKN